MASLDRAEKHICIGILAHVDAGKTTLAEAILYKNGKLRRPGRVDHGDAFLDTYEQEKARGITIFSKQALLTLGEWEVTLLDTPGHVDFSAEMERTLQVLDAAVLVISGADGVQGHVETLWRLLGRYRIPVFLFINKMDQPGTEKEKLLAQVQERLDERCLDFDAGQDPGTFWENAALCEESLMEEYLETGSIKPESIRRGIRRREIFPCYFGSALKLTGVDEFLAGIRKYMPTADAAAEESPQSGTAADGEAAKDGFGARVYKISRDAQGSRLTHMKITRGCLKVKMAINGEKADQIRIYDGAGYQLTDLAVKGMVCAVTGLEKTASGQGLGLEKEGALPLLEPVLTYRISLPEGGDVVKALGQLRQLEEEIPELHIVWKEQLKEIHAQIMGEVQIEVLKTLIWERFHLEVNFGTGSIVYKETIAAPVEGIGHYEPLRHYAEVHLLLEPGEAGSGLQFSSACSEDVLDRNWQRLILTHLEEKRHVGVLTGSEITDMRITLVAGRAHLKHTEGGDFRQATYRAVRQGLRKAESILLEPVYRFRLEIPSEMIGRALTDIQRMNGSFEPPETEGEMTVLKGKAPVATMGGYQREVAAYTHGRGRLLCELWGYEPCHNSEEVIRQSGYDPEADLDNPTGSVFCAHGAGFLVSWDQVDRYAHVESGIAAGDLSGSAAGDRRESLSAGVGVGAGRTAADAAGNLSAGAVRRNEGHAGNDRSGSASRDGAAEPFGKLDQELEEIFTRTYGPIKRDRNHFYRDPGRERLEAGDWPKREAGASASSGNFLQPSFSVRTGKWETRLQGRPGDPEQYLLVDGYNIIFAWEDLQELAAVSIDGARNKLMDILCNYQGFCQNTVILVFDAYKVKGNPGSVEKYHNIYVVYTKEAETADQYIEKTVHRIARTHQVTVATSDALEQVIIWGEGANRLSARGLWEEIQLVNEQIREITRERIPGGKNYPFREQKDQMAIEEKKQE